METMHIKELLDRYFEGQTSLAEEEQLRTYFSSGKVADELLPYRELFAGLDDLHLQSHNDGLADELMDFIIESEHKEKSKFRFLWQAVSAIAAVLLLALLLVNFPKSDSRWTDTYDDPQVAYAEATKTLQFVAAKYNEGMHQLKPVGKLTKAIQPLDNGLKQVNRGFDQVENLGILKEKLKQQ